MHQDYYTACLIAALAVSVIPAYLVAARAVTVIPTCLIAAPCCVSDTSLPYSSPALCQSYQPVLKQPRTVSVIVLMHNAISPWKREMEYGQSFIAFSDRLDHLDSKSDE